LGMARQTGVADKMFRTLAAAGVNIQMITTSEIKISVLVELSAAQTSLRAVHQAFQLDRELADLAPLPAAERGAADDHGHIAEMLRGVELEELYIDAVRLDESQSRVTIRSVPDAPGVAAQVFEQIAADGVFVDMIVQNLGRDGRANLSFTVPREQLPAALAAAEALAENLHGGQVTHSANVAKLSVSGIGLRSHTGVAIRMFKALSAAGINVDMINTSEVRVNVVVAGEAGAQGLAALNQAFADILR
ncbi:MAG: ACT domain-containing protein, partial [Planctomycetales bacterium]|nr:ACT domain-containing protein [Planctomycetales bacterium]